MKVLELNTFYMRICGIQCNEGRLRPMEKALKIFTNFLFMFGHLCCLAFCGSMYIYRNSHDVLGAANASILCFAGLSMFGSYLGFLVNEATINNLHHELQTIVNDGKSQRQTKTAPAWFWNWEGFLFEVQTIIINRLFSFSWTFRGISSLPKCRQKGSISREMVTNFLIR